MLYFLFQTNMTNIAIIIMFGCKLCVHTLLCNDVNIVDDCLVFYYADVRIHS